MEGHLFTVAKLLEYMGTMVRKMLLELKFTRALYFENIKMTFESFKFFWKNMYM
jgi:hypothetical protein